MAEMTIATSKESLRELFGKMTQAYYKAGEIKSTDLGTTALAVDIDLPVISDGVGFDMGSPNITETKLISGETWYSTAEAGDASITLQVSSVSKKVSELFIEKKIDVASATGIVEGITFSGEGYNAGVKKVTGSMVFMSEDKKSVIILPNMEAYGTFKAAEGTKPAYYDVSIRPALNSEGVNIFILRGSKAA